jgi:hypothetical protein
MAHVISRLLRQCVMLVCMLGISLLLGSCYPASLLPKAVLEISGRGDKGTARTLQINASSAVTELRFSADAKNALSQTFAQAPYLEYALVYQGNEKWHLFYAAPPTGVITPTNIQAHVVITGTAGQLLFAPGPVFSLAAASPISATNASGAAVKIDEGIRLINRAMGWDEAKPVFSGEAAVLMLSDGTVGSLSRTLVIFGSVQPNGDLSPKPPGGIFDIRAYCVNSPAPPSWCCLVVGC